MKKLLFITILALGAIVFPPVQAKVFPPIIKAQPFPPVITAQPFPPIAS
jgi:hypothetical protein